MSLPHAARGLFGPMPPRAHGLASAEFWGSIALAAVIAGAFAAYPFARSQDGSAMAAQPAPAVSGQAAPAQATTVAAVATVGTPCEHNGWPYVDRRCTEPVAGERTRQVRVIGLDRVAPTSIVTPIATIDPSRFRLAATAAPSGGSTTSTAGSKSRTGAPAAQGRGRVKVTAQTVPSQSTSRHRMTTASLHVPAPQVPAPARSVTRTRGGSIDALAYGETRAPTQVNFFGINLGRGDTHF